MCLCWSLCCSYAFIPFLHCSYYDFPALSSFAMFFFFFYLTLSLFTWDINPQIFSFLHFSLLCRVLTELVSKMRDMQMDKTELGCLRAIILFNPGTYVNALNSNSCRPGKTKEKDKFIVFS